MFSLYRKPFKKKKERKPNKSQKKRKERIKKNPLLGKS